MGYENEKGTIKRIKAEKKEARKRSGKEFLSRAIRSSPVGSDNKQRMILLQSSGEIEDKPFDPTSPGGKIPSNQ
jgi:hypothetical protein